MEYTEELLEQFEDRFEQRLAEFNEAISDEIQDTIQLVRAFNQRHARQEQVFITPYVFGDRSVISGLEDLVNVDEFNNQHERPAMKQRACHCACR